MDPVTIRDLIYDVASAVRQTSREVKINENQYRRLVERIDTIVATLESMEVTNVQNVEHKRSLENLETCFKKCQKCVEQFKDGTSWYSKAFYEQTCREEFEELNQQLLQCAIALNSGINVKQVFDPQMDESDRQNDLNAIQAKTDEIARMMARQQEEQFNQYETIKTRFNDRFNSFRHNLNMSINRANDPVMARKITEEENAFLHIPYYDLLLEQKIGGGGFADVYHGRWLSRDHEVAIKVIRIHSIGGKAKEEFIKEFSMMHQIRYDHLLNIFGVCMEEGRYAFVVEYMSLGSLYNVLREEEETIQLTWPDRWSIAQQMTKGINYLHMLPKPIIHRDIKSLNILMTKKNQGFLVKVGDFGLAKVRHETSRQSSSNNSIGTLPWKAPELLRLGKHTEASDVYALGIVLWELATGCVPYEDADESVIIGFVKTGERLEIPEDIPGAFVELISSAWAHEPQQRPSCQMLLSLISKEMESASASQVVPPNPPTPQRPSQSMPIETKPPIFVTKPTSQVVKQGETAVFMAQINGYPTPVISWSLKGKRLTAKEGVQIQFDTTIGEAILSIENVDSEQHTGWITCQIENPHGDKAENIKLDVFVAPMIIMQLPKQQETVSGRDITLKVMVKGSPRPYAQWFFEDTLIESKNTFEDMVKNEYQLLIKQATVAQNEGSYRVILTNEVGEMQSTPCSLVVLEPVELVKVTPTSDSVSLDIGEQFELAVDVTGKKTPKVELRKNGEELMFTSVQGTRYIFLVANVKLEHRGVYTVIAKNETSTEEMTVTLGVIDNPATSQMQSFQDIRFIPYIDINTRWKQYGITIVGNSKWKQFSKITYPKGIFVDNDDQCIYIVDCGNDRIVEWKFDAMVDQIVGTGNEAGNRMDQLNYPTDIILDKKNDSLIIGDKNNRRVVQWSRRNGTHRQTLLSNIDCLGLTMGSNGDLYVSNWQHNLVTRWKIGERNETIVAGGNGKGNDANQLNHPSYIFVGQDQSIYVSDTNNHRVMKWVKDATEGIVVAGGHGEGNSLTQLSSPAGLIVDHLNNIYVADWGNHRIMRWLEGSTKGQIIVGGNGEGRESNQLQGPVGLSFDREGSLYVADCGNHRVQKFEIDLSLIKYLS